MAYYPGTEFDDATEKNAPECARCGLPDDLCECPSRASVMYAEAARAVEAVGYDSTASTRGSSNRQLDLALSQGARVDGANIHELDATLTALRYGALKHASNARVLRRLADELEDY